MSLERKVGAFFQGRQGLCKKQHILQIRLAQKGLRTRDPLQGED